MPLPPNTENLTIGRGTIYFDRLDDSGNYTGELNLGNATELNLRQVLSKKEHFSSRGKRRGIDLVVTLDEKFLVPFTLEEYSKENLILAVCGDKPEYLTQSDGSSTSTITAYRGRWIELGYRSVSGVVVSHGVTVFQENVDYLLDKPAGRIMPLSTGAVYELERLLVSFSYAAINQPILRAGKRYVYGLLRFIPNITQGMSWELKAWRVKLRLAESIQFITDDWGKIAMVAELEADDVVHPTEPYFTLYSDTEEESSESYSYLYWKYNEGVGTLVHEYGYGKHGNWYGGGVHWSGAYGLFNGTQDYVRVPFDISPILSITVGGTINRTDKITPYDPVVKKTTKIPETGYSLECSDYLGVTYRMQLWVRIGDEWKGSPLTPYLTYGVDYHVVGVYDGANVRIYVNGVESGTGTSAPGSIVTITGDLYMGWDNTNPLRFWYGKMKNIRLYINQALTAEQVLSWYNEG